MNDTKEQGPMLSDAVIVEMRNKYVSLVNGGLTDLSRVGVEMKHDELRSAIDFGNGAGQMRSRYENLITSGELMVVKLLDGNGAVNMRPTDTWTDCPWLCDDCGTEWMMRLNGKEAPHPSFCPGCGHSIVE